MKKRAQDFIHAIQQRQVHAIIVVAGLVFAIVVTGASAFYLAAKSDGMKTTALASVAGAAEAIVAVVGEEDATIIGNTGSNNSWSGEIISLNNLQVQPEREGTIAQWYVHIGERVRAGQRIGKLSRPPQTPEMVGMLAEKSQMLAESRASVTALRAYTEKRIAQSRQLRVDTETTNVQKLDILGRTSVAQDNLTLSSLASKKKMARVVLRRSIVRTFPVVYGQTNTRLLESQGYVPQMSDGFGAFNVSLRNYFYVVMTRAWMDAQEGSSFSEQSGLAYFDTAIKLAGASVTTESLTEAGLEGMKEALLQDQSEFIAILGEIKDMELEVVNTQRESIDTQAEIDEMITDLEKDLAMAEGDVRAKEAAYTSVSGAITSGYVIVAPNSGVVSSIMKKSGEFVGPGMPIATVTAEGSESVVVRMLIPNNIQKPKVGEELSVIRPGFGTDVKKARLIGVGNALDDGAYMADAVFTEETTWPIGTSVRVLEPESSSNVLIAYTAIFWSEGGIPTVWAVSEAGRIYAKKITIGRSLGAVIEVYTGLKKGDRYVTDTTLDVQEGMLLEDLIQASPQGNTDTDPEGSGEDMGGMEM